MVEVLTPSNVVEPEAEMRDLDGSAHRRRLAHSH